MTSEDLKIVGQYLTTDEPFGPVDASEIEGAKATELLFEHHNQIYRNLRQRPSIVVGRKGSGKTSYLTSVHFANGYKYVASLDTSEALSGVITAVGKAATGPMFAESVAKIWEHTVLVGLFADLRERLPPASNARRLMNDYLAKIGVRDGSTLDDALWKIADVIAEGAKDKPSGILANILRKLDSVTFGKTKKALVSELDQQQERAAVLIDSLDDFQLQMDVVGRSLQGLLKFAGESNKPSSPIDVRLCLPAELYHRFIAISTNPNKDFRRKLLIHWVASELVFVAAHRIALYSQSHGESWPVSSVEHVQTKTDARRTLEKMLPPSIECKLGVTEDPLAYIIRHTQLLPRHFLMILNSISQEMNRSGAGTLKFTAEAIRKGISKAEETIVQEILVAYRPVYPHAKDVCEQCIPELHMVFSLGDLERIFRTHGKSAMQSNDFLEFRRMLIEIGAVGRVLEETDRYTQGQFEYTVPHKLVTATDDMLCIHPLFAEIFSAKIRQKKPVYPYGSRIDDLDYRAW